MMKHRKRLSRRGFWCCAGAGVRLSFAAAAFAALASAPHDAAAQTPRKGGKLIVAVPSDVLVWDPKFTNGTVTIQAQQQIYANLIQNSSDGKELRPSLAESYEVSADAKSYTFKLRQNAKFCDGSPITAADAKFSFDRAMEQDSRVTWQFPNKPLVEALDDKTLRVTLDRPNVAFVSYLTLWGSHVLSKAYAEKVGIEEMGQKPLGSGAFCLDRWVKGQLAVLKRNPNYWDPDRPYVDEVELRVVQDENAAVLQLRSGQIDIATSVPHNQFKPLKSASGIVAEMVTIHATVSIVPNIRTVPAFQDVKIRQAMLLALDRQAMVDALLFGNGEPAQSPIYGPKVLFHTSDFGVSHDLDKAKKLMAESSAPQGFSVKLIIPSGDEMASQAAVIVNDQLARIGIKVQVQPTEAGTWWQLWSTGNFEMVYKLGSNLVIDPAMNLPFDFWSKDEGGRDAAFSGYRNAEIVRISKAAEAEPDQAKRAQAYRELQRIAMSEVPQLYLFHPSVVYATRDSVKGYAMFPTRLHRFWEVWKAQ
jgi:peptide/nickel transport system substrate-binding protein